MATLTTTAPKKTLNRADTDALLEKAENFAKLSTVKQSDVVHRMYARDMNQKEIAEKVGVSIPQVSNLLTIHSMPKQLKKFIEEDKLSGTLVLQVRRDQKEMTDDEVAELLNRVYDESPDKDHITKKDLMKVIKKHNSLSILKKLVRKHKLSVNTVKQNDVTFGFVDGLMKGKLSQAQIIRFFGLDN